VTDAVIRSAPNCRIVARFGIGLDNIAVATATEFRIPVTNVPDYCVSEVADHTVALVLACARKVSFFHLRTKSGEYKLQTGSPLRRLSSLVLGLVGFGRIAANVFAKARALGFDVLAHCRSGNDRGTGCRMVGLDELLRRSDFVSLHLPLTAESRRLLGSREFALMKPSAVLINTSRGGLVDHDALWRAIQSGQIAGAALDVFDPEPPDLSLPLFRDERVLVTPHAAFLSEESLLELRRRAARQITAVLQGLTPENVVNPQIHR
jgi:D-3-phosphoglycerate dehydrogenase